MLHVSIRGEYTLTEYDTLSGRIMPFRSSIQDGNTVFTIPWHIHTSLLLRLDPHHGEKEPDTEDAGRADAQPVRLMEPVS